MEAVAPAGVGLVFDRVSSGEKPTHGLSVLKPGGELVSTLNNGQHLGFAGINSQYVLVEPNALRQDELRRLADAGEPQVRGAVRVNKGGHAELIEASLPLHMGVRNEAVEMLRQAQHDRIY